jgi:hypothetical protein
LNLKKKDSIHFLAFDPGRMDGVGKFSREQGLIWGFCWKC